VYWLSRRKQANAGPDARPDAKLNAKPDARPNTRLYYARLRMDRAVKSLLVSA